MRRKVKTTIMMRIYRGRVIEERRQRKRRAGIYFHNFKDKYENKDWDKDEEDGNDKYKDKEKY